jgi:hypothetical protein
MCTFVFLLSLFEADHVELKSLLKDQEVAISDGRGMKAVELFFGNSLFWCVYGRGIEDLGHWREVGC